ncbi:isoflavonoid 7-o-beta-apiosyl-glucoside beta-glycosidase [Quercus suber]|uniref:Isoflavonoid 7-o-beta-apiosyl-glucoside beta-glycosidase n=1 Tax=Quercus suber TaxID=58331 RepID=A0AAW0LE84_QUESU
MIFKELANGAFVLIGVNYYTSNYAGSIQFDKDDTSTSFIQCHYTIDRNGALIDNLIPGCSQICVYLQVLRNALIYMKQEYHNIIFYVTENNWLVGLSSKKGVNVKGYFMWSFDGLHEDEVRLHA